MQLIDLTLSSPELNLALDEALALQADDEASEPTEFLRIWEPTAPMVVVGRGSSVSKEVNIAACEAAGVPVLRRSSGGAAIVAGPGCLMFAVVVSYDLHPDLRPIDRAHCYVLRRLASSIGRKLDDIRPAGISDLAWGDRKVSGNSMRCLRRCFLYHGTLLYAMQLELIERYLHVPPRQPEYRGGRSHVDFVANLPLMHEELRAAVIAAWGSPAPSANWPSSLAERLAVEKYSDPAWNLRHA